MDTTTITMVEKNEEGKGKNPFGHLFRHVYVINLLSDVARRDNMIRQLKELGIPNEAIQMVNAVDGQNEDLSLYDYETVQEWVEPFSKRAITRGEIGCALSHYGVWKHLIASGDDRSLILEDDVVINIAEFKKWCAVGGPVENALTVWSPDLFYMGRKLIHGQTEMKRMDNAICVPEYSYGTHAYILSRAGAVKMVESKYNRKIIPADEYMSLMIHPESFPYKQFLKYYDLTTLRLSALSLCPANVCIDVLSGVDYKSTTYHTDPAPKNTTQKNTTQKNNLLIITVASDQNDPLTRFTRSCDVYGYEYKILGLGRPWKGGNMAAGPGGGQKVNLLLEELSKWDASELASRVILFTDSYDVVMNAPPDEIMNKYEEVFCNGNKYNSNNREEEKKKNKPIVFAAECYCWPDKSLAQQYPADTAHKKFRYLNSGGFIGYASDILNEVLLKIEDHDDDQLFYTRVFLSRQKTTQSRIMLDTECEIFQALNGAVDDMEHQIGKSRLYNRLTKMTPCVIHGNGPEETKRALTRFSNYLGDCGWNLSYRYCNTTHVSDDQLRKVMVYLPDEPSNFSGAFQLNIDKMFEGMYPRDKLLFVKGQITDAIEFFLTHEKGRECATFFYYDWVHYETPVEGSNMIRVLLDQMASNKSKRVVAPLLRDRSNPNWSNFWGDLTNTGYYKRAPDYLQIVHGERHGVWNVPYVTGMIMMSRDVIEQIPALFTANPSLDMDMRICKNLRDRNVFMWVTNENSNLNAYSYRRPDVMVYKPDLPVGMDEITIFDYGKNSQKIPDELWERKYLDPRFMVHYYGNQLPALCKEPCKDAYNLPVFTKAFADEIIKAANDLGDWSDGRSDKVDPRLGTYENVPTRDIHMHQLGFHDQWEKIVKKYIAPVVSAVYNGYNTKGINIAFIVKYSMDGQRDLVPHHDASVYTINVCLNRDYTGGGCKFIRQNCVVDDKEVGEVTIHPGRLTHYHEGLAVTSGERYILVSFVN